MSVHIRPHYASIGVPQWRHNAAHEVVGQQLPDMSGVTITADRTDYDLYLPDSVWLTIYEDLGEHFARKAAASFEGNLIAALKSAGAVEVTES